MNHEIHVNSEDLETIDKQLATAVEEYEAARQQLISDMNDLTNSELTGTLAAELMKKFEDKLPAFKETGEQTEELRKFSERKTKDFSRMIDDATANLK